MFRVEQTSALEERTGTRERVVAVGFINHRERRVEFERGEYGRGGEEEGWRERARALVAKAEGKDGERYCEIVNPKTNDVVACARNGEGECERGGVMRYLPTRHCAMMAIEKVAEVGFRTVSSDAYDSKGYSNNTNASSETTAAAAEEEDEEDLNSPEAKKRRKSIACKSDG